MSIKYDDQRSLIIQTTFKKLVQTFFLSLNFPCLFIIYVCCSQLSKPYICTWRSRYKRKKKNYVINYLSTELKHEQTMNKCTKRKSVLRFEMCIWETLTEHKLHTNNAITVDTCDNGKVMIRGRKSCFSKYGYFIQCRMAFSRLGNVCMTSFSIYKLQ